jgi:DNA-binding transcriptional ArsR family regulator
MKILKALADETRLNIILNLLQKERSVLDVVSLVGKSQPNVSLALRKLEDAGIVVSRKEGKSVFYSIKDKEFVQNILKLVENE